MSEFPISNGPFGSGSTEQGANQILQERQSLVQSELSQSQPKGPSVFRQVLGGVAGLAGNMFAPGLGGALGRFIGGSGGSSGPSGLFGSGNTSAFANNLASSAASANASNLAGSEALEAAAQQSNEIEEMVSLQANLEKARHESFMSVIQTIGSS
jgi:hypothetical protein